MAFIYKVISFVFGPSHPLPLLKTFADSASLFSLTFRIQHDKIRL